MPGDTSEAERTEPVNRGGESNSVRFSESQRNAERARSGESGRPPESSDRADSAERHVLGQPERLAEHHAYQGETNDCALYTEKSVAGGFGVRVDLEKHRDAGKAEGIYSSAGTAFKGIGRILEREGIQVDRYETSAEAIRFGGESRNRQEAVTLRDEALAEGKGVIAIVESGELWGQEPGFHAVHVTGVEGSGEGGRAVVTNDSGIPDGAGMRYPEDRFNAAWEAASYKMVMTKDPMPEPGDR